MKLVFKNVRVILCLTSIYASNHGWSMEDPEMESPKTDKHRDSPISSSSDDDSPNGFQRISKEDATAFSKQAATVAVVAAPAQNHWFWDATIGRFTAQQKQPAATTPQPVSHATNLLIQAPAGKQITAINAIAPLLTIKKESPLLIDVDDGEDSGTEGSKSPLEDLNGIAVDSAVVAITSALAIQDPANALQTDDESTAQGDDTFQNAEQEDEKEESETESNAEEINDGSFEEKSDEVKIETNNITDAAATTDSFHNNPEDVTANTKTHETGIITVQPGGEQTTEQTTAQTTAQTTVVQDLTDAETLSARTINPLTNPAATISQEGEGIPFFTQATVVALGLSIIILPRLVSYWAKK